MSKVDVGISGTRFVQVVDGTVESSLVDVLFIRSHLLLNELGRPSSPIVPRVMVDVMRKSGIMNVGGMSFVARLAQGV